MAKLERWIERILWVVSAGLGLAFIFRDVSVWPWDPAYYGEVTLTLYQALRLNPEQLWSLMISALGFKAPGITWLGMLWVPLAQFGLRFETALLLFVLCTGLLSASLVVHTTRYLSSSRFGAQAVACMHMLSAPLFVGLLYHYFTEQLQLLAVCIVLWGVMVPRRRIEMVGWGVLGLALGMLAKVSTPLYIIAPGLIGLWKLFRSQSSQLPLSLLKTTTAWVGALALSWGACSWYSHNNQAILSFLASTSSGPIAELYGSRAAFSDKFVRWSLWSQGAFFLMSPLIAVWLALVGLALIRAMVRWRSFALFDTVALLSVGQLLVILAVFSLQVNEETRYLLPALPYVALLSGYCIYSLRGLALVLLAPLAIAQFYTVHATSWGGSWTTPYIGTPWLKQVVTDPSQQLLLTEAVKRSCTPQMANRYMIVGLELPYFNANTAAFYSAKSMVSSGYRCFYTSLGYAESNADKAMARLDELKPEAVLYLKSFSAQSNPDPFNAVSTEIKRRLEQNPQYRLENIEKFNDLVYFDRVEAP